MGFISSKIPDNICDFSFLDLIVFTIQENLDIAAKAAQLIVERYGIVGAKCLLIFRNHSPKSIDQIKGYILELLGINLEDPKYSSVRSEDEMRRLAQPYPLLSPVAGEVALCELLSAK